MATALFFGAILQTPNEAQKKCVRAIAGIPPWESCRLLFKEYRILTLPCMYILEAAKFARTHSELFVKAKDKYPRNTRDPERIVLPRAPKTALYSRNCYAMCGSIYNNIPNIIKELPFTKFCQKLKLWLLQQSYYTVDEFIHRVKRN